MSSKTTTVGDANLLLFARRNPKRLVSMLSIEHSPESVRNSILYLKWEAAQNDKIRVAATRLGYREFWKNATKTPIPVPPTPRIRMGVAYIEAVRGYRKLYPYIVDHTGEYHVSHRYVKVPYQLVKDYDDRSRRDLDAHQKAFECTISVPCSFYDELTPKGEHEVKNEKDRQYLKDIRREEKRA